MSDVENSSFEKTEPVRIDQAERGVSDEVNLNSNKDAK